MTKKQKGAVAIEFMLWIGVWYLPILAFILFSGELAIFSLQTPIYARNAAWTKALNESNYPTKGMSVLMDWRQCFARDAEIQKCTTSPGMSESITPPLFPTLGGGVLENAIASFFNNVQNILGKALGPAYQADVEVKYATKFNLPGFLTQEGTSGPMTGKASHIVKRTEFDLEEHPGHWEAAKSALFGGLGDIFMF